MRLPLGEQAGRAGQEFIIRNPTGVLKCHRNHQGGVPVRQL